MEALTGQLRSKTILKHTWPFVQFVSQQSTEISRCITASWFQYLYVFSTIICDMYKLEIITLEQFITVKRLERPVFSKVVYHLFQLISWYI